MRFHFHSSQAFTWGFPLHVSALLYPFLSISRWQNHPLLQRSERVALSFGNVTPAPPPPHTHTHSKNQTNSNLFKLSVNCQSRMMKHTVSWTVSQISIGHQAMASMSWAHGPMGHVAPLPAFALRSSLIAALMYINWTFELCLWVNQTNLRLESRHRVRWWSGYGVCCRRCSDTMNAEYLLRCHWMALAPLPTADTLGLESELNERFAANSFIPQNGVCNTLGVCKSLSSYNKSVVSFVLTSSSSSSSLSQQGFDVICYHEETCVELALCHHCIAAGSISVGWTLSWTMFWCQIEENAHLWHLPFALCKCTYHPPIPLSPSPQFHLFSHVYTFAYTQMFPSSAF